MGFWSHHIPNSSWGKRIHFPCFVGCEWPAKCIISCHIGSLKSWIPTQVQLEVMDHPHPAEKFSGPFNKERQNKEIQCNREDFDFNSKTKKVWLTNYYSIIKSIKCINASFHPEMMVRQTPQGPNEGTETKLLSLELGPAVTWLHRNLSFLRKSSQPPCHLGCWELCRVGGAVVSAWAWGLCLIKEGWW